MQSQRRFKQSIVLTAILLASLSALAAADAKPVVNINTADAKQLALLPRVGLAVAQRIVDYRKQNGPFKSADELMLVRGIGEKLYAQLKPYVVTSGETTLAEKVASAGRAGKSKSSKSSKASAKSSAKPSSPAAKTTAKGAAKTSPRTSRTPPAQRSARASRTQPSGRLGGQPAAGGPR
jgi:competence protein ComEA